MDIDIEALTPNCPIGNPDVTHPHVRNKRLCLGDAEAVLKIAKSDFRVLDMIQIIETTLNTYNPDSPYVSIDRWYGDTDCGECGSHICSGDEYYC